MITLILYSNNTRTCRQYYSYVTDTQCKRVGTQCWVYGAIMVTEALLCIKNGKELFERTQAINIIIWLLLQLLLSVLCVYGCVLWHKYFQVCCNTPYFPSLFYGTPMPGSRTNSIHSCSLRKCCY